MSQKTIENFNLFVQFTFIFLLFNIFLHQTNVNALFITDLIQQSEQEQPQSQPTFFFSDYARDPRSLANGRWGLRPGKRSVASSNFLNYLHTQKLNTISNEADKKYLEPIFAKFFDYDNENSIPLPQNVRFLILPD